MANAARVSGEQSKSSSGELEEDLAFLKKRSIFRQTRYCTVGDTVSSNGTQIKAEIFEVSRDAYKSKKLSVDEESSLPKTYRSSMKFVQLQHRPNDVARIERPANDDGSVQQRDTAHILRRPSIPVTVASFEPSANGDSSVLEIGTTGTGAPEPRGLRDDARAKTEADPGHGLENGTTNALLSPDAVFSPVHGENHFDDNEDYFRDYGHLSEKRGRNKLLVRSVEQNVTTEVRPLTDTASTSHKPTMRDSAFSSGSFREGSADMPDTDLLETREPHTIVPDHQESTSLCSSDTQPAVTKVNTQNSVSVFEAPIAGEPVYPKAFLPGDGGHIKDKDDSATVSGQFSRPKPVAMTTEISHLSLSPSSAGDSIEKVTSPLLIREDGDAVFAAESSQDASSENIAPSSLSSSSGDSSPEKDRHLSKRNVRFDRGSEDTSQARASNGVATSAPPLKDCGYESSSVSGEEDMCRSRAPETEVSASAAPPVAVNGSVFEQKKEFIGASKTAKVEHHSPAATDEQSVAPTVRTPLEDVSTSDGQPTLLKCSFNDAETCSVSWYKDGYLIPPSLEFIQQFDGVEATLRVPELYTDDAGVISCRLRSSDGVCLLETSCQLTVIQPFPPTIVDHLSDMTATDGASITFSAKVTCPPGFPLPITWLKDDQQLQATDDCRQKYDSLSGVATLCIDDVYRNDAGTYTLLVTAAGTQVKSVAKLHVQDKQSAQPQTQETTEMAAPGMSSKIIGGSSVRAPLKALAPRSGSNFTEKPTKIMPAQPEEQNELAEYHSIDTLQALLHGSTDFERRRAIRARIREIRTEEYEERVREFENAHKSHDSGIQTLPSHNVRVSAYQGDTNAAKRGAMKAAQEATSQAAGNVLTTTDAAPDGSKISTTTTAVTQGKDGKIVITKQTKSVDLNPEPNKPAAVSEEKIREMADRLDKKVGPGTCGKIVLKTKTTSTKTGVKLDEKTFEFGKKQVSAMNKFKEMDAKNSQNAPNYMLPRQNSSLYQPPAPPPSRAGRSTNPRSPGYIKEALLCWCRNAMVDYPSISVTNFSSSWSDGMAFCALIHHFYPESFDFSELSPRERRKNFQLAFDTAEREADIAPLLDVDDMMKMGRNPDWRCVFTYVQSFYRRFRDHGKNRHTSTLPTSPPAASTENKAAS